MKTTIFTALVLALLLLSADRIRAQSDRLQSGIVFAPNAARRVTVTRNGALLAAFTVPKGTFLSASYDGQQPTSIAAARWEFHGNVELRAAASDEAPRSTGTSGALPTGARSFGPGIQQRMSQAPLVLTAQGVDVVIENVER